MKEIIKVFLRRAVVFENDARNNFKNGDFDIAMFHLEQAAQLMVKAKLLDLKGSFQRTHSLRRLLSELSDLTGSDELKRFIDMNKRVLRDLERAYISSRYIYDEFFEEEVKEAFRVVNELRRILWRE